MSSTNVNDRNVLQLGAIGVLVAGLAFLPGASRTNCGMTPEVASGLFYPTQDRPEEDTNLTRVDNWPGEARGEIIHVRGQVLDEACRPIENATVELWQADAHGRYQHERHHLSVPLDSNFQGWARAVTDAQGRYGFKTVKPAPYPVDEESAKFRSPHIHFRVTHPEHYELITEMYFAEQPLNKTDSVLQQLPAEEREQITVRPSAGENARGPVYSFDLTLSALKRDLVSPELLDRYVGTYQLEARGKIRTLETQTLQISRDGNRLYVNTASLSRRMELRPLSESRFDTGGLGGDEIQFHPDEGAKGTLTLDLGKDRTLRARKVGEPSGVTGGL